MEKTPTEFIRKNLSKLGNSKCTKVVLISTGSYNPVHRGHIEIFKIAKEQLEKKYNFKVVGAYISPTHGIYVSSKLQKDYIDTKHRLKMCQLAIEESGLGDFLALDPWESSQDTFIDFPYVTKRMSDFMKSTFPKDNIRVMYLCGADHVLRCGCYSIRTDDMGVVAINRPGYKKPEGKGLFNIETVFDFDISSTLIRKKLAKGEKIDDLTYPSVAKYIYENKILS